MSINLIMYILAYIIGSIPCGLMIAKFVGGVDIRKEGSGSIGATNVFRVLNSHGVKNAKKIGTLTILLDAFKGFIPIMIAKFAGFDINVLWTMGVLAVIGHCFSVFLKFEGGKGVATSFGVFAAFLPLETIISVAIWFGVGKFIKISSIASLSGIVAFVIISFIFHYNIPGINTHAPIFVVAFIVFYKHIPNIKRLIFKEETKVI
ncbi:glycerol-3-phosphate 1-O-acyltransferase PlsY [Campylobacter corcagiensis]|uniref:Glycerol-3-phosphate acyltransferase n=1 Tax=Campylobacter corcagiensis TaxID=1448857 RepID=A0A7M1LGI5_9BACT|nr:glycerol-3-phosphate 1-O-acyltransferase PlsY [Campylobacter corcagiensis]QKF64098.1 acyl phosphate:glycerol-3-phosphate acyltransferase [Campylobacter corcagiensis]QOQ87707.1 glycerol-3-phosphate 1-O-acyltransferase PlsY [Campylobacter corcagiensis]